MIESIRVLTVAAPLAVGFDHASHTRTHSASVLVELTLASGHRGWGEGAPRPYVTGETLDSAVDALVTAAPDILADAVDWRSVDTVVDSLASIDLPMVFGGRYPAPAAAAAWETAVLDAACRVAGRLMSDAVRMAAAPSWRPPEPVPVSLVIDLSRDVTVTLGRLPEPSRAALRHVKVKVGRDVDDAVKRVAQAMSHLTAETSVSVDVNGAWRADQADRAASRLAELGVAWIEEPTSARDWAGMARLCRAGVPVMLDESCGGEDDLRRAADAGAATHVNIRVSKCGGIIPSVRLAACADALDIERQLGVQVAEIGPLWAVGRALATSLTGWRAVEAGRGDEWFLEPLTEPAFAVDRTRHLAAPLTGPGTGITPTPALLGIARPRAQWCAGDGSWRAAS
ncbi:enolase C-terminal domain-like protein [Actinoallomurus sp. NPDC052274]|uniref:enolase C-terminal domain-like protein n=1 Tax=Actinoallomurus sp. NPDC052274 TaxID=3155420 RepID=UPI0034319C45